MKIYGNDHVSVCGNGAEVWNLSSVPSLSLFALMLMELVVKHVFVFSDIVPDSIIFFNVAS